MMPHITVAENCLLTAATTAASSFKSKHRQPDTGSKTKRDRFTQTSAAGAVQGASPGVSSHLAQYVLI